MEIEYYCNNCEQSVCTCNVRCPGCGSLLSNITKHVKISLAAEIISNGENISVPDKTV